MQLVPVVPQPFILHLSEVFDSVFSITTHQLVEDSNNIPF